ncbi:MAG: PAS domain S-box protein, partial [Gemmatimonadaceae bacterium]
MDSAQRIIVFNEGAEKMFGYAAGEVMGQPLTMLLPERARAIHADHIEEFGRSAIAARRMGERGEIAGRRKNGEIFPAEASISKVGPGTARVYTAVLRDITERKRAEAERTRLLERAETARAAAESARAAAESAERRTAFLANASALLDRSLDYETTLQNLAALVVPERADVCFIDIVEGGMTHRVASAAANDAMREIARQLHRFPRRSDEPYLTRESIVTGRSVLLADATRAALEPVTQHVQHLELLMALEPRSCMMVPLMARGRTLGAMAFVGSGAARCYGSADLALAEELAHRAALAVDNARLYGAAQRATRARDEILGIVSHDLRNPLSAIAMCGSALDESLSTADDGVRYMVDT